MAKFHAGIKVGSSPRMRGTPWPHTAPAAALGLIPTYAGNTRIIFWRVTRKRAHPHVCGEHAHGFPVDGFEVGSSPRMRGTPKSSLKPVSLKGLIPTYAGNTGKKIFLPRPLRAHPHVCGEHHDLFPSLLPLRGSSPRMRGTHLLTWGFIPTHQVLELVWSPKPVLTLHDFRAYRRREARLYLLALLHPFRGPRSSFGADGRIISFTPSKSTGSHG